MESLECDLTESLLRSVFIVEVKNFKNHLTQHINFKPILLAAEGFHYRGQDQLIFCSASG